MLTQKRLLGFMLRIAAALTIYIMASPAISAPIEWVTVGSPNITKDNTGYGAVGYEFQMAKYETTNAQYVEFLNAVAGKEDVHGLYHAGMTTHLHGGIARQGSLGNYVYTAKAGMDNKPVNHVSFYDTLRFANWVNNGQGAGDTENGAYTLAGGNPVDVARNTGASIFLPSQDEWYKAAYYDAVSGSFFDYPTGSNNSIVCGPPSDVSAMANCDTPGGSLVDVGSYASSGSPSGTYDQAGNVFEWFHSESGAFVRGGAFGYRPLPYAHAGSSQALGSPQYESFTVGFRIAGMTVVPEPSTGLLLMAGLLGLTASRKAC